MLRIDDSDRVRTLTLDRPEALNAFNEALYDEVTDALITAHDDPGVAVVLMTGAGRAFSAGADLFEMARHASDPDFKPGRHGFVGMLDRLIDYEKPFLLAINGIGLGIGATIIGFADLVFMSSTARLRCPFTDLAVAPEAASSYTFPTLLGRQRASWLLLSSEWVSAEDCERYGLVFEVCEPDALLDTAMEHARLLAAKPISSLRASKRLITARHRAAILEARAAENAAFQHLMAGPANQEALAAFAEKRKPDFTNLPPGW